jgi:hypothetical protein
MLHKSHAGCLDGARDRQLRYSIRAGLAFEIHFGARLMELPLVSLSSQPSGFNSLQIRYVLIVFFVLSMPLKSVSSGSERHH